MVRARNSTITSKKRIKRPSQNRRRKIKTPQFKRRKLRKNPLDQNDSRRTVSRIYSQRMPPNRPQNQISNNLRNHLSGNSFLKCAFAGFDNMGGKMFQGVPDEYAGQSLSVELVYNTTITVEANTKKFLWFTPSAGVAYMTSDALVGTSVASNKLSVTPFPLFNSTNAYTNDSTGQTNFTLFRLAGHNFQLTNNTPMLNRGGSLNVVHYKQILGNKVDKDGDLQYDYTGNPPTNTSMAYVDDATEGATGYLSNEEGKWLWKQAITGAQLSEFALFMEQYCSIVNPSKTNGFVVRGFDNEFDSCVMEINAGTTSQSFTLRVSQCIEMRVDDGTLLETMTNPAAEYDPTVLNAYKEIRKCLPRVMRRKDNGNFWDTIKNIISKVSGVLSYIPGPVGMIAKGVSQLTM